MFVGPFEAAAATIATGLGTNLVMAPKPYFAWGCFSKNWSQPAPSPLQAGRLIDEDVGVRGGAPGIIPTATPDPDDRWQHRMSELLRGLSTCVKSPCSNEELSN